MTRGYFVLEMKGLLHAAALMSDAYLESYGKEIIEAFLNNNEERLLDTLRAKMNEKDRTEMDRYICPEWYRITKKSEAKDYIAEYGYVISAEKLKIYNKFKNKGFLLFIFFDFKSLFCSHLFVAIHGPMLILFSLYFLSLHEYILGSA